ncbi:MAG: metallophosphoesterase [Burkholderiaceae bacterium]|nr:metallophosphoesterase [Burkholderiaceae bacterium]
MRYCTSSSFHSVDLLSPSLSPRAPQLLVQLSDSHVVADRLGLVKGVATAAALHAAVEHIQRQGLNPDLLLLTGDLAHDGAPESYETIADTLWPTGWKLAALPGNHDDLVSLRAQLGGWCVPVHDLGEHWRVVMLDTTVAGAAHGHLNGAQFALLDRAVAEAGKRHIVVAMHHNPVVDQTLVPDRLMLDNARILLQHLTAWREVRVVVWGHVHRAYDCRVDNMRMLAAPSTAFQFKVTQGEYVLDTDTPAGYRWLKLYDDGSIATGITTVPPST